MMRGRTGCPHNYTTVKMTVQPTVARSLQHLRILLRHGGILGRTNCAIRTTARSSGLCSTAMLQQQP